MPHADPWIVLDEVSKAFGGGHGAGPKLALDRVSLSVQPHSFVALLGPSGCGKTTLLRLVDGLLAPDSGSVRVFGEAPRPGPDIGFVFQSFRLIPWATALANVEFALRDMDLTAAERRERAERHLDLVGLSRVRDAYPRELSGGMKQRVALARALAPEPRVLLMDEPFASIDAQARELMQIELMRIWSRRRSAVLFVTHSVDEAILLADRIALLGPAPGRIVELVDVDLDRPRQTYELRGQQRFLELCSFLSRRLREFILSDPSSDFYGRDLGADESE